MTPNSNKITVVATNESVAVYAKNLAKKLDLKFSDHEAPHTDFDYLLAVTPDRLELQESLDKNSKPIFVDFLSSKIQHRIKQGGGKNQLIAKAIGIKNKKNPFVIDATAGFGTDAFILASLGCEVLMLERSPIIGALLEDGLKRLEENGKHKDLKLNLQTIQSYDYIKKTTLNQSKNPDVIYLDPMYPKRSNTALNKKNMRILHEIVGCDPDASKLLNVSLARAKNRVVVKRPKIADNLGHLEPDLKFLSNGSCRYDVYFSNNLG